MMILVCALFGFILGHLYLYIHNKYYRKKLFDKNERSGRMIRFAYNHMAKILGETK